MQVHPAPFPMAKPSPTNFEKNSFNICLIGGSQEELVVFDNTAMHYIITFLLEPEVTGLSLLEQMLYGIKSRVN